MKSVRRRDKRGWYLLFGVFMMVAIFSFLSNNAKKYNEVADAASLANFDPGYIISDYQMGNYNSMTESEIQAFLIAKGNCRDTRTYLASQYSSFSYHIRDGHFVCLAEETFGEGVDYGESAPNGESAAHIIWQAAQDYQINPQVLIVLLQKEQGLITDSWPNSRQFKVATGYGCPDTAPCNSEYYGFKNQIRKAAALFRTVLDGGWTNYPLGNNYVQYSPNASCGGSVVNIRNLATSALYRYTPYQPNAGALAAGYGTTGYCGAYGNRNFYLYFEDWFGGITSEQTGVGIEDGEYTIKSKLVEQYNITEQSDKLINSSLAYSWIIEKQSDGYYTIKNKEKLYLSVLENNELGLQSVESITSNQRWRISDNHDGTVTIKPYIYPDQALDVDGASTNDGSKVQLYHYLGKDNIAQKWMIEEAEVPDISGDYYIMSALFTDKAIDVSGGGSSNGVNVQIYTNSDGNGAQQWSIRKNENENSYTIVNIQSGKALDVSNGALRNNSNIQIYDVNNSCAQKWKFRMNLDGTYGIRSYCDGGLALDVQDLKTNVQIYSRWGGNDNYAQKWILKKINKNVSSATSVSTMKEDLEDGIYSIHSMAYTNKALDVENGSFANAANLQIYSFSYGNMAQEWEIKKNETENYYIIKNAHSRKVIDVAGGVLGNNTNVWMYDENNTCAQRWIFELRSGESYVIKNACNPDLVLDLQDFHQNIQIYTGWGDNNAAQKWKLNKLR